MMTRTEKEKMLAGDLYNAGAPELQADMAAAQEWLERDGLLLVELPRQSMSGHQRVWVPKSVVA